MLCKKIQELDTRIRFAGVINERGRLVAGGMQEVYANLMDTIPDKMIFVEVTFKSECEKTLTHTLERQNTSQPREKCNEISNENRYSFHFC